MNEHQQSPAQSKSDAEQITGTVENIVYRSEESGYTVCSVKLADKPDVVTVVGNCSAMWNGETLSAKGEWTRHKKHGFQFQAKEIICVAPTSLKGIERYLASGIIRGVGKVNAERLVKAFGKETLKIIEKESKRLEDVEGIGPKRRAQIKESWGENKGTRDIMIFLQGHGIGTAQSARIFKEYGSEAIAIIRTNPYRLCEDIWGLGFKTADGIAMSVGIEPQSEIRARAGIVYVLRTMNDDGHCFCTEAELILQTSNLLEIEVEIVSEALNYEIQKKTVRKDTDRIYISEIYYAEVNIVTRLQALIETDVNFKPIEAEKALLWASKKIGFDFAPMQEKALLMSLTNKVSVITGGPGVGKTTIIKALVDVFKHRKLVVQLAAPTGRAAKRMSEATDHAASTIHRLLKFIPATGRFEHDADNPLEGSVFILDEVSMIDVKLMSEFLNALPDNACLVLVGDTDQLPSIGPGNVLRDIINSGAVKCAKLDTIFRQEKGGWIVRNAHLINSGETLESPDSKEESDFYFINTQEPDQVIEHMKNLITNRIPKRFGFDPASDIQVLTPMRKNQLGADNLNAVLQETLNPSGPEIMRFGRSYRKGDRVMQIRNNYDKDIFNGDIGQVSKLDQVDQILTVNFDGRKIQYEYSEMDELVHAFACTIHKSQGSEYPVVIILITTQHYKMLQRNLLYTAITRGKKLVCLIGSARAVSLATKNNEIRLRRTGLRERLSRICA